MFDATGEKTQRWLLILIGVVATFLGQTYAWEIFAPSPPASGVFAKQTQASTGENYDGIQYDALDYLLAAKGGVSVKSFLLGEGAVGTYDDFIAAGSKGDNVTPHHIPSANHMAQSGVSKGNGISINMEQPFPGSGGRHRSTFTYGTQADLNLTPRQALGRGILDARRIYQQDSLYGPGIRASLQDVIRQNRAANPGLFNK